MPTIAQILLRAPSTDQDHSKELERAAWLRGVVGLFEPHAFERRVPSACLNLNKGLEPFALWVVFC